MNQKIDMSSITIEDYILFTTIEDAR